MDQRDSCQAVCVQEPSHEDIETALDELHISSASNLINALQDVQERLGYLSRAALQGISRRTGIRLSRVYGVVTFYAQFYTEPRGRHTILCCRGTACHVRDGNKIIQAINNVLGIADGETTEDMLFSFDTVACLGACALAPVIVVDGAYHGKATTENIRKAVAEITAAESLAEEAS